MIYLGKSHFFDKEKLYENIIFELQEMPKEHVSDKEKENIKKFLEIFKSDKDQIEEIKKFSKNFNNNSMVITILEEIVKNKNFLSSIFKWLNSILNYNNYLLNNNTQYLDLFLGNVIKFFLEIVVEKTNITFMYKTAIKRFLSQNSTFSSMIKYTSNIIVLGKENNFAMDIIASKISAKFTQEKKEQLKKILFLIYHYWATVCKIILLATFSLSSEENFNPKNTYVFVYKTFLQKENKPIVEKLEKNILKIYKNKDKLNKKIIEISDISKQTQFIIKILISFFTENNDIFLDDILKNT